MNFRIGQKVVCVRKAKYPNSLHGDEITVKVGVVYTIRELYAIPENGHLGLRFLEIRNEPRQYLNAFMECGFYANRFRPLVERKTDISIFTRMLTPSKEKVS